ncbi:tyrosine-type recombinase/integrase [Neolewinella litorea]|uniref:Integrase n=1 Tax=Neolewinella litorea TaxID=2562452 RepID=A0A4S4N5Z9_9BACT|nr:tyrosine-type recombinase/integrase [Neolewinella litorea]THH34532.1 integrase [Neolewinella litorea]
MLLQTTTKTELQSLEKGAKTELIIARFIAEQDVKSSSKRTYQRGLKQWFSWVEEKLLPLPQVTRAEVLQYKTELLAGGLSPLTVGSYLTVLRKFYEWTEANKLYPNVAKGVKTPRRKKQFKKQPLSIEKSKELLDHFQGAALRDYAIVNLLLRTGLRTIEAVRADVKDITYKQGKRVLLIQGKGRESKDSFVILTDKAYQPIANYLESRKGHKAGEPLFTSTSNNNRGGRLTTRTISSIAKEGLRAIGIDAKEFTAHSFRHTTAVNILRAGGTLANAQSVLRHESPATTQIYTATIEEEIRLKEAPEALLDSVF